MSLRANGDVDFHLNLTYFKVFTHKTLLDINFCTDEDIKVKILLSLSTQNYSHGIANELSAYNFSLFLSESSRNTTMELRISRNICNCFV